MRQETLSIQPWMNEPRVRRVMAALGAPQVDVRFVGGCVRDAVMGRAVGDIDIATPEVPAAVQKRLENAGIKAVPTGLDHGTITAIADGKPFEITTLRRDTACDGRHAVVEFTTDWSEDARRRDFTFNAMSLRMDGALFDDHGGIDDAKAGRVRFVGDPGDRIREDYLRILRLFRFFAWFGREPLDPSTLAACGDHAAGTKKLSIERIQQELIKLLTAPQPVQALRAMEKCGVLHIALPEAGERGALERLIGLEDSAAWLRRLAALLHAGDADAAALRLKLSNADRHHLELITSPQPVIETTRQLHRALYIFGAGVVIDRLLLARARGSSVPQTFSAEAWEWTEKTLPVGGEDVLALGIAPGPRVGELLRAVESWWIDAGFKPPRAEALAKLRSLVEEAGAQKK